MPNLYPVAAVLIVERRKCQCCKLTFTAPSEVIHELCTSHSATDFKQAIPRLPAPPPCNGVSLRTTRYVDTIVQYCHYCWKDNIAWQDAAAIRPAPPKPEKSEAFPGLSVRPGVVPATLDELMA